MMKYPDGQEARLWDKVKLWNGNDGVVVCSVDTDEFSNEFSKEQWEYLQKGVLILSQGAGLIHYPEPDEAMCLLERQRAIDEHETRTYR